MPFMFDLRTEQGNDEGRKVAEIIQRLAQGIGVQVGDPRHRVGGLLKEYMKKRNFEAHGPGLGDHAPIRISTRSGTRRKTGPDQLNRIGYANAEVDALLEKGRSTCVRPSA